MLTIQYIPYGQLSHLSSQERVQSILSLIRIGKILIIDGRLSSSDETLLIRETMDRIDYMFNGIEIAVMHDDKKKDWLSRIKHNIASILIGDRSGITFIGPASIISELRQHPENIELHFRKDYLLKHLKTDVKSYPKKIIAKKR
jgi:hypothetical protein